MQVSGEVEPCCSAPRASVSIRSDSAAASRYCLGVRAATWVCFISLTTAIGCGARSARPRVAGAPSWTPQSVVWSPLGDRVIVDQRISVPVNGDGVTDLPDLPGATVIFAADGRVAQLARGALLVDGVRTPLPTIQAPPVPDVEVTGLWIDLHRLYLHEWHPIKETSACRLFDRRTGGLRTLARCVTAGRPTRLLPGPGSLVAVHEVGAAGPMLSVHRFSPDAEVEVVLRHDLRPDGVVEVAFSEDGGAIHFVSRCDLSVARPCVGPARLPAPRHTRYDVLDGTLTALQSAPSGAVPGPDGRLAWPTTGGVCLSATPGVRARCIEMVPPNASGYTPRHDDDDHP